jgi:hypothetical protein
MAVSISEAFDSCSYVVTELALDSIVLVREAVRDKDAMGKTHITADAN